MRPVTPVHFTHRFAAIIALLLLILVVAACGSQAEAGASADRAAGAPGATTGRDDFGGPGASCCLQRRC